jgi:4'-phosphopantetheinyl transferase
MRAPVWAAGPGDEDLLRARLLAGAGRPGAALLLEKDGQGRPWARVAGQRLPFSHGRHGGVYAAALGERGAVGVDLAPPLDAGLLEGHLLPGERAWLETLAEGQRGMAAGALWAAKEAVLKALGVGLAWPPDQVELGPREGGGLGLARLGGSRALAEGWRLRLASLPAPGGPLLLALAWTASGDDAPAPSPWPPPPGP